MKFLIAAVAVWAAALGLAGFSYLRPDGAAESRPPAPGGEGRQTSEQTSEQISRQSVSGKTSAASGPEGRTELTLTGEPGTPFSGSCTVDGEERRLSGETPRSFSFGAGKRLECEISSRGGPLRISFSGGGTSTSQQIAPGGSALELTYTGDSLSLSTSSGNSQTTSSQTSSSQTSSSQTSSSQSSSQTSSSQVSSSRSSSPSVTRPDTE